MLNVSIHSLLNSIVPISRFNKGEANKIFDEVSENGYKIVIKNNKPTCVLLSPERYEEIMEQLEDSLLLVDAQYRMEIPRNSTAIPQDDLLKKLGITSEELEQADEAEIE